jgi:hypothetical protein
MLGQTRGKPVDVKPRPRAILELSDDMGPAVEGVFPYEDVADSQTKLHDADWDVLITDTGWLGRSPSLFTIAFDIGTVPDVECWAAEAGRTAQMTSVKLRHQVQAVGPSPARDLIVPDGLPSEIERLVRADLIPGFENDQPKTILQVQQQDPGRLIGSYPEAHPEQFLDPFLCTSDGSVLAGRVRRRAINGLEGECWLLPSWIANPGEWVRAAWSAWHTAYPTRIPAPPDWSDSETWHTPKEAKVAAQVKVLLDEKRRLLTDLAEQADALEIEFVKARKEADAGPRRVLSAQAEDLVTAVQGLLEDLGFEVQNMDLTREQGDRREDLRVRDEDAFEAIAEVRGYKGGAQSNDLLRIGRFSSLYGLETGHLPSAQWYIANELLNQDPGTRPPVLLASKPDEVREFGENPGAVISSVALYRLWQKTISGEVDKDEARKMLRDCRGQFTI